MNNVTHFLKALSLQGNPVANDFLERCNNPFATVYHYECPLYLILTRYQNPPKILKLFAAFRALKIRALKLAFIYVFSCVAGPYMWLLHIWKEKKLKLMPCFGQNRS